MKNIRIQKTDCGFVLRQSISHLAEVILSSLLCIGLSIFSFVRAGSEANVETAVLGIVWIVMQVKLQMRVAKSFGKGKLWGLGLFLVPFVTSLILGFGSAEYLGNPEEQTKTAAPGEV